MNSSSYSETGNIRDISVISFGKCSLSRYMYCPENNVENSQQYDVSSLQKSDSVIRLLLFLVTSHIQLFCDPMNCSLPGCSVHGTLPGKSHGQRSLAEYSPWGCIRVEHDLMTTHAHNN